MKIVFVLPGHSKRPTGGGRVVYQYANGLCERGHDVTVVHPRTLFYPGTGISVSVWLARMLKAVVKPFFFGLRTKKVEVSWQYVDPRVKMISIPAIWGPYIPRGDVIIATLWRTAEYVNRLPSECGEKFYFIQHHETWSGPEERVNRTWLLPLKKIVIAKWLMELGRSIGAKNLFHVPNAIDHSSFFVTKPGSERRYSISMLYSPHPWKGAKEGIEALVSVKKTHPNLSAVVFGVSARPDILPDWVDYHENPPQKVLRDTIYNGSAIYLCPSWLEGWGLPITEAMACGCAVVSADNGGVRDFVEDGVSGLIAPARNSEALAEKIRYLLDDPNLLKTMAKACLASAKDFTYSKSVLLFESVLVRECASSFDRDGVSLERDA